MESLRGIISDVRVFLYGGVLTLPLTIAGTLLILGLFTANYAMLFFLVGYLILVPLANWILHFLPFFDRIDGDICKINIPYSTMSNPVGRGSMIKDFGSTWVSMIAFFIGYIFTNGLELYNRESVDTEIKVTATSGSDIDKKVSARKTQAIITMISTIIFAIGVLAFRYYTGCENMWSLVLNTFVFVWFGHGWYKALSSVGEDRLSDLFGIANRLLPPGAIANGPIACVPIRA